MSEFSKIEWTKSTFNPWIGCTKVSPGCDHCYAEVSTPSRSMKILWGAGQPRHRTGLANWNQVRRWNAEASKTGEFWPVFTASLADIFDNEVPGEWRADFWALVRECRHLTFQILTKRIGNAPRMLPPDWGNGYPNVWLISSIVNQEEADRDIWKLLQVPAVIHGLSMEPLLGPVDLTRIDINGHSEIFPLTGSTGCEDDDGNPAPDVPALNWIIVGGESGPKARPMHPECARSLRDQCAAAGVPFLYKQWGEWLPVADYYSEDDSARDAALDGPHRLVTISGSFWDEEFDGQPPPGTWIFHKVGKKSAGRLLDGVQHDGYPNSKAAA
ncbi:MAG: hypothetical protein JWQ10_285 [Herbaspirillum sp.]|nr:hypothetical protein [Herbaspirillum sp.]